MGKTTSHPQFRIYELTTSGLVLREQVPVTLDLRTEEEAPTLAHMPGMRIRRYKDRIYHSLAQAPSLTYAGTWHEEVLAAAKKPFLCVEEVLYEHGAPRWCVEEGDAVLSPEASGPSWDAPWAEVLEVLRAAVFIWPQNSPLKFVSKENPLRKRSTSRRMESW